MFGSLQDWMSNLGILAGFYIVAVSLVKRDFLPYFFLNFYVFVVATFGIGRRAVLNAFGFQSPEYLYVYYYTDTLLTIFLYFAILNLYERVFQEMKASRYIRRGGLLLLSLTACVSYLMIHQNAGNMTNRFVIELSQNLYFVGVVLTYVLWGAVVQLRETRLRLVQLILALGVFFSAHAVVYAARHMFPGAEDWFRWVLPVIGVALPLSWAYTFSRVSEETRLVPAHITPRAVAEQVATAHR